MIDFIYHMTTEEKWAAVSGPNFIPDDYIAEGFIHASFYHQLKQVADFIFHAHDKLLVLEIDPSVLTCEVKVENTMGGPDDFPHIYGHLPVEAVTKTFLISNSGEGFVIPPYEELP
jgi:uncharacterized protein (DUF952 family)